MIYGLIADTHAHNWSAFSSTTSEGINSRLVTLLGEIHRCADEVHKAGGDTIVFAGDMFHVRGSVAPSVLNPTLRELKIVMASGIKIVVLAGNHDLENKESDRIGSAVTALEEIGCKVVNYASTGLNVMEQVVLIPWIPNINDLKVAITAARDADPKPSEVDLVLHAPIDGVIPGLPDHGLTAEWLGKQGFRRVFSGHYHNHKDFGNGVYSIGALAHHTWSDVGSRAGFLIVSDDSVRWFKSHAPEFVEIDQTTSHGDVPLLVDGNYCRAKINSAKQKEVEALRAWLTDCGAKGVVILEQKDVSASARSGGATISAKAGMSLAASVAEFVKVQGYDRPDELAILCNSILDEAKAQSK